MGPVGGGRSQDSPELQARRPDVPSPGPADQADELVDIEAASPGKRHKSVDIEGESISACLEHNGTVATARLDVTLLLQLSIGLGHRVRGQPSSSARARTDGSLAPGAMVPEPMAATIWSTSCP